MSDTPVVAEKPSNKTPDGVAFKVEGRGLKLINLEPLGNLGLELIDLSEATARMSTPGLVEAFYARIWNSGDLGAATELLTEDFSFRGSLGAQMQGVEAFKQYVRSVRGALADYRCEILACVTEGNEAFAKMRFSGRHVAPFRGYPPTGRTVQWLGAALFRFEGTAIAELWVLGDLAGLDAALKRNQET